MSLELPLHLTVEDVEAAPPEPFGPLGKVGPCDESAPMEEAGDGGRQEAGPTTVEEDMSESDPGPELAPLPVTSLKQEDS